MTSCSLIISTYNWLPALTLCLRSCTLQSVLPDEIIVADDGSRADTSGYITRFAEQTNIPVKHIWQPDEGFQLAKIRNKAIAAASGDYIIQIDGDLILHKDFIKDHINIRKQNRFVTGSRMLLSKEETERAFKAPDFNAGKFISGNKNVFNSVRIPCMQNFMSTRYKKKGRYLYYVKGCNMAFWREDLVRVNGYNENFIGWGREDSDIAVRLINAGLQKQFLKFGGISFHLYHKEAPRNNDEKNTALMNETIAKKIYWAEKGLNQYL